MLLGEIGRQGARRRRSTDRESARRARLAPRCRTYPPRRILEELGAVPRGLAQRLFQRDVLRDVPRRDKKSLELGEVHVVAGGAFERDPRPTPCGESVSARSRYRGWRAPSCTPSLCFPNGSCRAATRSPAQARSPRAVWRSVRSPMQDRDSCRPRRSLDMPVLYKFPYEACTAAGPRCTDFRTDTASDPRYRAHHQRPPRWRFIGER